MKISELILQKSLKESNDSNSNNLKVKCIFHEENTPSLNITKEQDSFKYKCFGCDSKGDIVNFYQQAFIKNNKSFNGFKNSFKKISQTLNKIDKKENFENYSLELDDIKTFVLKMLDLKEEYFINQNIIFDDTLLQMINEGYLFLTKFNNDAALGFNLNIKDIKKSLNPNIPFSVLRLLNNDIKTKLPLSDDIDINDDLFIPLDLTNDNTKTNLSDYVFIVEGEKDMLMLRLLGIKAYSFVGGVKNFRISFNNSLNLLLNLYNKKTFVILSDNDDAGRDFKNNIYQKISFITKNHNIKIKDIENILKDSEVKDITEFIQKNQQENIFEVLNKYLEKTLYLDLQNYDNIFFNNLNKYLKNYEEDSNELEYNNITTGLISGYLYKSIVKIDSIDQQQDKGVLLKNYHIQTVYDNKFNVITVIIDLLNDLLMFDGEYYNQLLFGLKTRDEETQIIEFDPSRLFDEKGEEKVLYSILNRKFEKGEFLKFSEYIILIKAFNGAVSEFLENFEQKEKPTKKENDLKNKISKFLEREEYNLQSFSNFNFLFYIDNNGDIFIYDNLIIAKEEFSKFNEIINFYYFQKSEGVNLNESKLLETLQSVDDDYDKMVLPTKEFIEFFEKDFFKTLLEETLNYMQEIDFIKDFNFITNKKLSVIINSLIIPEMMDLSSGKHSGKSADEDASKLWDIQYNKTWERIFRNIFQEILYKWRKYFPNSIKIFKDILNKKLTSLNFKINNNENAYNNKTFISYKSLTTSSPANDAVYNLYNNIDSKKMSDNQNIIFWIPDYLSKNYESLESSILKKVSFIPYTTNKNSERIFVIMDIENFDSTSKGDIEQIKKEFSEIKKYFYADSYEELKSKMFNSYLNIVEKTTSNGFQFLNYISVDLIFNSIASYIVEDDLNKPIEKMNFKNGALVGCFYGSSRVGKSETVQKLMDIYNILTPKKTLKSMTEIALSGGTDINKKIAQGEYSKANEKILFIDEIAADSLENRQAKFNSIKDSLTSGKHNISRIGQEYSENVNTRIILVSNTPGVKYGRDRYYISENVNNEDVETIEAKYPNITNRDMLLAVIGSDAAMLNRINIKMLMRRNIKDENIQLNPKTYNINNFEKQDITKNIYKRKLAFVWSLKQNRAILPNDLNKYIEQKIKEFLQKEEYQIPSKLNTGELIEDRIVIGEHIVKIGFAIAGWMLDTDDFKTISLKKEHVDYAIKFYEELLNITDTKKRIKSLKEKSLINKEDFNYLVFQKELIEKFKKENIFQNNKEVQPELIAKYFSLISFDEENKNININKLFLESYESMNTEILNSLTSRTQSDTSRDRGIIKGYFSKYFKILPDINDKVLKINFNNESWKNEQPIFDFMLDYLWKSFIKNSPKKPREVVVSIEKLNNLIEDTKEIIKKLEQKIQNTKYIINYW